MNETIDLRRMIMAFQRRMRLFGAVGLFVFMAAVVFTLQATPKYTATASVMLDPRKEHVTDIQAVMSGLPADTSVVDTEVEVLKSRQLAERVVAELKLDNDPEFNTEARKPGLFKSVAMGVGALFGAQDPAKGPQAGVRAQKIHEKVIDKVLDNLSVKRAGLTYVINIGFTSIQPAKATQIANTFADKYLTQQLEARFDATRQANTWLNERLSELRGQVEAADSAVQQYKIANNLLSAGATTLTEAEISNYNQQVALARAQQAQDEAALRTARQQLSSGSNGEDVGAALDSPVIQQLRSQRAVVSGRVADLAGRYQPRHPEMLKAQRELGDIDAQIQAETTRIISSLQAKAEASRQRTASMVGSLSGAKGTLAYNSKAMVGLNELERKAQAVSSLYQSFLDRFKQTSSEPGVDQSDARVVSRAKIPTNQSSPKVLLNLALGVVLALGAGVGAIVLAEILDTGLTTAEDVEHRLDVPHLGSVPLLASVAEEENTLPPIEYLVTKPLSGFAEAFRSLRTSIRYARVGEPVKVIVLTSALPGEGKTTTSVCLGRSAAQAGDRVVIVDCDLRRRNINKLIGTETTVGLLEVLSGQAKLADVLLQDDVSGAFILPLAHASFTPKDVFGSPAMDRLIVALRKQFDLVILDTAPVLAVADTRVLAAKADAVVFLARWRKTPEKAIEASLKQLTSAGGHVVGLALTQVDMKQQALYGYGDPGYYYAEYKKYYAV